MAKGKSKQQEDTQTEFQEKVLYINRCSKVVTGGRKFSFSALVIIGDGKGRVGIGFAKANEVSDAIRKGGESARKNILEFELDGSTIPHDIMCDWDGARVLLKRAKVGTGVIGGSKVRAVLEISGIKDVVAKSLGSSNPSNQVKATFKALSELKNRKETLATRGITA